MPGKEFEITDHSDNEILLPVVSHHCKTTHTACDCVLHRLEKQARQIEIFRKQVKAIETCADVFLKESDAFHYRFLRVIAVTAEQILEEVDNV